MTGLGPPHPPPGHGLRARGEGVDELSPYLPHPPFSFTVLFSPSPSVLYHTHATTPLSHIKHPLLLRLCRVDVACTVKQSWSCRVPHITHSGNLLPPLCSNGESLPRVMNENTKPPVVPKPLPRPRPRPRHKGKTRQKRANSGFVIDGQTARGRTRSGGIYTMELAAEAMRGHMSAHSLATGPVMAEPEGRGGGASEQARGHGELTTIGTNNSQ
jgi:hypothetical protein